MDPYIEILYRPLQDLRQLVKIIFVDFPDLLTQRITELLGQVQVLPVDFVRSPQLFRADIDHLGKPEIVRNSIFRGRDYILNLFGDVRQGLLVADFHRAQLL